jgi:hypothetical protein
MWKANGKTTTLQLFLDSLSPKTEKLSLEEAMDLSRDRLILELDKVRRVRWAKHGKESCGWKTGRKETILKT